MADARSEVVLYADHSQFSVVDPDAGATEDDDGDVDRASLEDHVAVGPGSLTIFTATYGYVRVIVERLDEPPGDNLDEYDHVVEAPFRAASGQIAVVAVTKVEAELDVPPGDHVARIGWSAVDGADERDPEPRRRAREAARAALAGVARAEAGPEVVPGLEAL